MHRVFIPVAIICLTLTSCAAPPERLPVAPLPEDGTPLSYADVVQRARVQAAAANEAFYVNKWSELEDAATGLEKTARYLPKATEVPAKFKDKVTDLSADLVKEAGNLRTAAQSKSDKAANEVLQRVNLKVREMRPE